MTKSASTNKKPRKQHTPEFRKEALRLNKHIGVATLQFSLYESQPYAWHNKRHLLNEERINDIKINESNILEHLIFNKIMYLYIILPLKNEKPCAYTETETQCNRLNNFMTNIMFTISNHNIKFSVA
ncbi:hypothetical protein CDO01_07305 [Salmonella enterica subsp. enterica serovar Schwarzengrund]|nr:hypothetical protein CDO01_07305 [Salmonella enterica subsp. enterica serovar Schwarzengrund]